MSAHNSKREEPMINRLWERMGGTLIREYPIVVGTRSQGARRIDAIILVGEPTRERAAHEVSDLSDYHVVVVQAKDARLGMYLMGQTLFSKVLVERIHHPRSVRALALCKARDAVMGPLLEEFPGIEVVEDHESS